MISNIPNTMHSFLHGLQNGKNRILLACTVKKLYFIKAESLFAIKVFNPIFRPLRQSYSIYSQ